MYNDICFPFAKDKTSNLFVHPNDVPNGLKSNCYCFECKADLIAINDPGNKTTPHFRHNKDSNCNAKLESFLHLFAKEIFKNDIVKILLPEIKGQFRNEKFKKKLGYNNFEDDEYDILLLEEKEYEFDKIEIEKTYIIKNETIRVDIVASKDGNEIFIEPFYKNKIDEIKLIKINSLDKSTISIDLNIFINNYKDSFTKFDFIHFLQFNINSKEWVHIKNSKKEKLSNQVANKIDNDLVKLEQIDNKINQLIYEINQLKEDENNIILQLKGKLAY